MDRRPGSRMRMNSVRRVARYLLAAVPGMTLLAGPCLADYAAGKSFYEQGRYSEAASAFETAAERGDALAQFMMGRIYQEGAGRDRDAVRAYSWYAVAASSGYYPAVAAREVLARSLDGAQLARAQQMAADWRLAHPQTQVAVPGQTPDDATAADVAVASEPYSVAAVQRLLSALGYRPGPIDGFMGARTASAIRAFEIDRALPPTGQSSPALFERLRAAQAERLGLATPGMSLPQDDADLVASIKAELRRRGFDVPDASGTLDPPTAEAIRGYQAGAGLPVDGRPSPELLVRLRAGPAS
jgi:peptidoglycan hydrolase-like protein with peptidoglycan-binding domain